jgi:hypothetical protein
MAKISSYLDAIYYSFPDARNIALPEINGHSKVVLIGETNTGRRVWKFNSKSMIVKNQIVGKLLHAYDIPAPRATIHDFENLYFESYQYSENKTLYEAIGAGLPANQIRNVFMDALRNQYLISKISAPHLQDMDCGTFYRTTASDMSQKSIMVKTLPFFIKLLNYGQQNLYHTDLTPKNILVTPDGEFASIIDLDSVCFASLSLGLGMCITKYMQMDGNPHELYDFYEAVSGQKINRRELTTIAKALGIGRMLSWHLNRRGRK